MITWGICSVKMFKQAPQNIFDLALSEKGALRNENPAKFECKTFNAMILALDNTVNPVANFLWASNHWWNFGLLYSFFII